MNQRRKRWNSLQGRHGHLDDNHRGVRLPRHHHRKIPDLRQERAREALLGTPKSIPAMKCTIQTRRKKMSPRIHGHRDEELNVPRPLQQLDRHLVGGRHLVEELQPGARRVATRSLNLPSVVQVRENQIAKRKKVTMSTVMMITVLLAKVATNMLLAEGRPPNVESVRLRPVAVPRRSRKPVVQERKIRLAVIFTILISPSGPRSLISGTLPRCPREFWRFVLRPIQTVCSPLQWRRPSRRLPTRI
mmetsp:Transcript_33672/g.99212  ORF Transcript_33672/g.99212 Transcript_33672/m.99212 type:complete len:246 (+) Transcript_33672:3809-4546(+)